MCCVVAGESSGEADLWTDFEWTLSGLEQTELRQKSRVVWKDVSIILPLAKMLWTQVRLEKSHLVPRA
jgi:hypothetical protein